MKVLINIIYILSLIVCVVLGAIGITLPGAITYMSIGLVVSVMGMILLNATCTKENRDEHINFYNAMCIVSVLIAIASAFIAFLTWFNVPGLEDEVLIKFGFKEPVEEVEVQTKFELYTYGEEFRIDYDSEKRNLIIYTKNNDLVKSYNVDLLKMNNPEKEEEIKTNYHGRIYLGISDVEALYGILTMTEKEDSKATPYVELNDGLYTIVGNQLVIDEVFTKLFNKENIFKNKVLTIQGLSKVNDEMVSGILEEYYSDAEYKYIYNGKRIYNDIYVCKDYSKLTTPEKMTQYIAYLGMSNDQKAENIIGKEIKIGNEVVNKVRLYYYNNLDSLCFIEIIFTGKKDSIIFKESDAKFKFDNIQKLY